MSSFFRGDALELILLLSILALALMLLKLWRGRRRQGSLEKDKSGFYRYHKDTQFLSKAAYAKQLESDEKKEASPKKGKASSNTSTEAKESEDKNDDEQSRCIAVLEFDGDLRAKQHDSFAKLVDEVVLNGERFCEVVVKINSPGGAVPHYGHVFAEMLRLRGIGVHCTLTACVDVVAASGGYLAALPAHRIFAAPFAMLGSVGVVAFVPNVRRLLQRFDIEPRTFTAGRYKRTVSLTDSATPEEENHFRQQIEAIHRLFLEQAQKYRPQLKMDEIETGDSWTAAESAERELGLIDDICTSQDYILKKNKDFDVLFLHSKKSFFEDGLFRFAMRVGAALEQRFLRQ